MSRSTNSVRPAKLNRSVIVQAAIVMIERDGLPSLSARKLAAALGCEAMSLYYHLRNMDELLDGIVDALLTGLTVDRAAGMPADLRLRQAGDAYLALAIDYPNSFQLVATRRWRTPNAMAAVRSMVDHFIGAGYSPAKALGKSRILAAYLNGAGLALAAWRLSDGSVAPEAASTLDDVSASKLSAATVQRDLHAGLGKVIAAVLQQA